MDKDEFEGILQYLNRSHVLIEDKNGGYTFRDKKGLYQVFVRKTTTVISSLQREDYEFAFGTNLSKIQGLVMNYNWPTGTAKPTAADAVAPAKIALKLPEEPKAHGPSARGIMLAMMAAGKTNEEIHAHLLPQYPDRDPKSVLSQVVLNRKWLYSPAGSKKLAQLQAATPPQ